MKIEIEWDGSLEAKVRVEGREFTYKCIEGSMFVFLGDQGELYSTAAGIIANTLVQNTMPQILCNTLNPETMQPWEPWEELSEEMINHLEEAIDFPSEGED